MEEKKPLDKNTIIGFLLIFGILLWMLWINKDEKVSPEGEKEIVKTEQKVEKAQQTEAATVTTDSVALAKYQDNLGAFGYGAALAVDDATTVLENDKVYLEISNKGGQIIEARLKEFTTYKGEPVYLIKDQNANLDLSFSTTDNRVLNTKNLFFQPSVTTNGDTKVVSMRLKTSEDKFLEYRYELKPDTYVVDFTIRTQGLNGVVDASKKVNLDWDLKGYRHAKSVTYENRYTRLTYKYEDGKVDKLSPASDDNETEQDVKWLSYRQHFFSSILVSDTPFETVTFDSKNLVEKESDSTLFTKAYAANIPLKMKGGELNYNMHMYYGPTDYKVLKEYESLDISDSMPLGWGIFGVLNKYIFIPLFNFLMSFLPAGFAIIALTVLVKLVLSPVQYKQFLSQAKMKVLRPEITEINEKYAEQPMKKQQETMALYRKAGVNPMSGCIPALLQMPVFYALFTFFPTAFVLRQKNFLWADDLSAYDAVAQLPFEIPFYGNHVSLFPILASVAIFIYMQMTSAQSMNMQQQPGMPNMKFILYLSPLMMLIFFNNYASGLSLYYFISNTITILIMLAIKNFIIDEDKIHARIQENKMKPKKESKFQSKLKQMMEQAEAQQKANNKKK